MLPPPNDLPQMILLRLTDQEQRIVGIWWAEAIGAVCDGLHSPYASAVKYSREEILGMAAWLEAWVEDGKEHFTEKGAQEVQRIVACMKSGLVAHDAKTQQAAESAEHTRRQLETAEFDHLF